MRLAVITWIILASGSSAVTGYGGTPASGVRSAGQAEEEGPASLAQAREILGEEDWKLVQKEADAVKRTRKLAELAFVRLDQARMHVNTAAFEPAGRALTEYRTLMTAAFYAIEPLTEGNAKRRKSAYKEFDIRTRPHMSYLERLAREFTSQGSAVGESALVQARRLRAMALNRFSGSKIINVPDSE